MRSNRNVHPEWGYLAPTSRFVRTLRIVLVTTAVSATVSAAAVFSLISQPEDAKTDAKGPAASTMVVRQNVSPPTKAAPDVSPVVAPVPQAPASARDVSRSLTNSNSHSGDDAGTPNARPATPPQPPKSNFAETTAEQRPDAAVQGPGARVAAQEQNLMPPVAPTQAEPVKEAKPARKAKTRRRIVARPPRGEFAQFGGRSPFFAW